MVVPTAKKTISIVCRREKIIRRQEMCFFCLENCRKISNSFERSPKIINISPRIRHFLYGWTRLLLLSKKHLQVDMCWDLPVSLRADDGPRQSDGALRRCSSWGGYLWTPETAPDNVAFQGLVGNVRSWIGISDLPIENTWQKLVGVDEWSPVVTANWHVGYPQGAQPNHDCAWIEGGRW